MIFAKTFLAILVLISTANGLVLQRNEKYSSAGRVTNTLRLIVNGTIIREDFADTFSCEGRSYGYYSDPDNDCRVFHVCLDAPVDRVIKTFKWSFLCPDDLIFDQEILTCIRPEPSFNCADAPLFYHLVEDMFKVVEEDDGDNAPSKVVKEPTVFASQSAARNQQREKSLRRPKIEVNKFSKN